MTQTPTPVVPLKLPASFHREMAAFVRELEGMGWTGRMSKPGHAIMRAPDGETTCSITPKLGSPRHLANNRAKVNRWVRERAQEQIPAAEPVAQPATDAVDTDPISRTPDADGMFRCPAEDCAFTRDTYQAVRIHWAHKHTERVVCPECGRETSQAQAPRHLASHYREPVTIPQLRRDLTKTRTQLAEALEEISVWQQLAEEAQADLATLRRILNG